MSDWASSSYREQLETGNDWADKQSAYDVYDKTEKTVLAELGSKYEGSEAAKERQARQDPQYKLFVQEMVSAKKEANKAKVKYEAIKSLGSYRQTQESLKKAEITAQNQMA